jgi:hypothetical protein
VRAWFGIAENSILRHLKAPDLSWDKLFEADELKGMQAVDQYLPG